MKKKREVELNPGGTLSLPSSRQTDLFLSVCDLLSRPVVEPTSAANYHKSPAVFVLPFLLGGRRSARAEIAWCSFARAGGGAEAHNRYALLK